MSDLYIFGKKINSVFQLLGEKENDISYSVGWALANVPNFLEAFIKSTIGWKKEYILDDIDIKMQRHDNDRGFSDLEIEYPGYFHLIIEAKKDWTFPTREQLEKYANREYFKSSGLKTIRKIIVLTECSKEFSDAHFKIKKINDVEVINISWKDVYTYIKKAVPGSSNAAKRLLIQLKNYFENTMSMQKKDSNWVYVASLNDEPPVPGSTITNYDVVYNKLRYWHPIGNGYPKEPPNYIAFRHKGRLQSIHHILSYEVFTDPHKILKEVPSTN